MKKRLQILLFTLLFLLSCIAPQNAIYAEQNSESKGQSTSLTGGEYRDGTVLVTLAAPNKTTLCKKGAVSFDKKIKVEKNYNFGKAKRLGKTQAQQSFLANKNYYVSEISSDQYSTEQLMDKLENQAYVVSVSPDYIQHMTTTNDTYASEQWYLDSGSKYGGSSSGINHSSVASKTKLDTPVVCVMDSGINYEHEDLIDHMWINPLSSLGGTYGFNFVDNNEDIDDEIGHGTHCAGVIAATQNNQKGIAGISDAKLMALKIISDDGTAYDSDAIEAFNYVLQAKNEGINITAINCSWGGGESSSELCDVIQLVGEAGVLCVFSAGNDNVNDDITTTTCPYDLFTGNYSNNRNYLIITGASTTYDSPASFSDYGKKNVDLFAPGERILSTYDEYNYIAGYYDTNTENKVTSTLLSFHALSDTSKIHTDHELGLSNTSNSTIEYETAMDDRDNLSSGCIKYTMGRRRSAPIFVEINDENFDPSATYYLSMQLYKSTPSDSAAWQHYVINTNDSDSIWKGSLYTSPEGKNYFRIDGSTFFKNIEADEVYLDDIGVSVANPNTSDFGEYELMNGTSMAAPMVTGGVALLSEIYPTDTLSARRSRILSSVRSSKTLTNKCVTGGVFDLSAPEKEQEQKQTTATPITTTTPTVATPSSSPKTSSNVTISGKVRVKKITLKNTEKNIKVGKKIKLKVVVTPKNATNKKVSWTSSNKKWLTVSKKGVICAKKKGIGHTVKITVTAKDGSKKKASFKIKIKK